ncbi:MAG: hypothetical protein IT518_21895 [Burkholderiales bacterium]|nr:hypothetical protein [Burkholderiales bacterium]
MPHVDTLTFRATPYRESPFARPVAAITAFLRGLLARPFAPRCGDPVAPRTRQDLEVRTIEERFAHAHGHADLERMERAFNRRDGGGLPMGDWR